MKLTCDFDCTDEAAFIRDLTVSFAKYDLDNIAPHLDEGLIWNLVGDTPINGKANFLSALKKMSGNKAVELKIHAILIDAPKAAIHGEMVMRDGTNYGFSDFYKLDFPRAIVKSITSYVSKLATQD